MTGQYTRDASRLSMLLVICGMQAWLLATGSAQARNYLIQDLGSLTERASGGYDVNEEGDVAGGSTVYGGWWVDPDGTIHGEAWIDHAVLWAGGQMIDLGVLGEDPAEPPRPSSLAMGINKLSQIVGWATPISDHVVRGFLWLPDPAFGFPAGMNELPFLAQSSAQPARARAINDIGQIAGEAKADLPPSGPAPMRAVLWEYVRGDWQINDLGSLDGDPMSTSRAYDLNNYGQVVGESHNGQDFGAFLWLPEPAFGLPAGMNEINPAPLSRAVAINDLGQVVGHTGLYYGTWLWLPEPAYGLPAGLNYLGQFPIEGVLWTKANDINNAGQIVGEVKVEVSEWYAPKHGWIWKNGQYALLDDLIPARSVWRVKIAEAISDAGVITGYAYGWHKFLGLDMAHAMKLMPAVLGDIDGDGDVDPFDVSLFTSCLAGPDASAPPDVTAEQFFRSDLQGDGDVDLHDFAEFQEVYPG